MQVLSSGLLTEHVDLVVWHFDRELVSTDYDWERDNKMHIVWHNPR